MKRLLIGLLALVLALVVAAAAALMLVDANRFRPPLQSTLSQALGREVTLGRLHVSVFSGALSADAIRIGDDPAFGSEPFVSAKSLALGVRLWPLIVHRELRITSLTLDQPQVRLLQNRAGHWNFDSFGATTAPAPSTPVAPAGSSIPTFSVDRLRIDNGRIELRRAAGDVRSYDKVQLSADRVGTGAAFPFSMKAAMAGGGTLAMDGKLGPWHAGNAMLTPLDARLVMHDLNLVGAGLMSASDGVGGVLDIDTQIHAAKGEVQAKGRIQARQLKLVAAGSPAPRPVDIDYHASYRLDAGTGRIDDTTLGSGAARLALSGSFDNRPKTMQLNLHMAGKQLPVDDLQPLLPAFGVVLPSNSRLSGGSLGVSLDARGPLDALVIRGPVTLDNSKLVGFSLGAKLGGALALAGVKAPQDTVIRHAEATLKLSPSGLQADPASAEIADLGSFTGKGGMDAAGKLDFRMLVKLDKTITGGGQAGQGLGGLLGGSKAGRVLGGVLGGTSDQGIGVCIGGTASAPSFRVDPSAVTGLLKAGLDSGAKPAAATPSSGTKSNSGKDALESLLRGALTPKKKKPSGSGQ